MTVLSQLNQGAASASNSYKTSASAQEKIEISYGPGKRLSDMSRSTDHTNMSSVEGDSYESESDIGDYSDADLDFEELGDRNDDDEPLQTEAEKLQDRIDDEDFSRDQFLQHPDKMEYIRPARVMPSVEEMNACFYALLNAESNARARVWAVPIIEKWWVICLGIKAERKAEQTLTWKRKELAGWKAIRNGTRAIKQLGPIIVFTDEYAQMIEMKRAHSLIKSGIEERSAAIANKAAAVVASEKAVIRGQKAGKARRIAKAGMNKKTEWHSTRISGALAIVPTKTGACYSWKNRDTVNNAAGDGKRAQRKIRQEKERKAAICFTNRFPVLVQPSVSTIESEEDEELTEQLRLINRICVEKIEQKEKQELAEESAAKAEKELAEKEAKELAEFVTVMSTNKKPKKIVIELGFRSLKEQTIERRKETDKKFAARCDGFEDLGSKEKLADVLKFTSLCQSVASKKKCYHKNCRFAHSVEQLQQKDCRFGMGCKFVKQLPNGQYQNQTFGRTGKTCSCMHIGEHKRGFCLRMGLKYTEEEGEKVVAMPVPTPLTPLTPAVKSVSIWAKVVTKAEAVDKMVKCKAKMTKAWSTVVVETLTEEKKAEIYGKGVTLLGVVSDERDSTPIIPTIIRKPYDKRGLGFFQTEQKTSTKNVIQPGFSWVKGEVLLPPKVQRWDVMDPVMVKVAAAVQAINERVAEIQNTDLMRRVTRAKAKAAEITKRLVTIEKKSWTKVEGRKVARKETKVDEPLVLRVPKADAELALLGAIRNGLSNFRIECI